MINTEYLAIIAIFGTGTFFGVKAREALYNFREYIRDKRELE